MAESTTTAGCADPLLFVIYLLQGEVWTCGCCKFHTSALPLPDSPAVNVCSCACARQLSLQPLISTRLLWQQQVWNTTSYSSIKHACAPRGLADTFVQAFYHHMSGI